GAHRAPQTATVGLLADALELQPAERARLDRAIVRRRRARSGRERAAPPAGATRRSNLPAALTRFVGRAAELDAVQQLLETARLVTLAGPSGIGKTRLAVEVAEGLVDRFADGVWLIELATLRDEALVARSVAATFDVREEPNRPPAEALVEFLRRKRL